jgi:hypothetical protein
VQHARIDRGGQQVVGGGDGVNVAGQVQVEILHRDDLRIAAACRAALDAEGRPLRGLADGGKDPFAEVRAQGLAQADGGGGLAFAERGGGDGGHVDVFAVAWQAVSFRRSSSILKFDFGLIGAVFEFE